MPHIMKEGSGYRWDRDGWCYVHIEGDPKNRGYQHGTLLAKEINKVLQNLRYLTYFNTGKRWEYFVGAADDLFTSQIPPEFLDEIKGIAEGAAAHGVKVTWQEILAWNGYGELLDYWWPIEKANLAYAPHVRTQREHCSAFMAHNKATVGGKIVMAHNSWDNFETGQFCNVIFDIHPTNGYPIMMQASPGFIDSYADFFLTGAGIMGTETTMGGFCVYKTGGVPEFARVRQAMQYADRLDKFVEIMVKGNTGGYANSWLLGDINTNDILRFELGLQFYNVEPNPSCDYFIGFNAALDPQIRNLECENTGFADIRRHQGARQVRLADLMDEHFGRIDVQIGQQILADHHDVYLNKDNPCSRTVDGHYELDAREYMSQPGRPIPYQPRGTVDGKVCDSDLAKIPAFWARWGNSSGTAFYAEPFLKEHRQWDYLRGYLIDRPAQPWSYFQRESLQNSDAVGYADPAAQPQEPA